MIQFFRYPLTKYFPKSALRPETIKAEGLYMDGFLHSHFFETHFIVFNYLKYSVLLDILNSHFS